MDSRLGRRACGALTIAVALLGAPAAAHAAYAPKLSISVDPKTTGARVALTSTITQAVGEEANRTVRVHFPLGFGFDLSALGRLQRCADPANCPPASRLGAASADTPLGAFSGDVFLGEFPKLYVTLHHPAVSLFDQHLTGTTEFRADGGIDVVFDNLPNLPTARFTLALDGPPTSVLVAPRNCGDYEFTADFVSQSGVRTTGSATATIDAGCPAPAFGLSAVSVSPTSVVRGRTVRVRFTLPIAARYEVTVRRMNTSRVRQRRRGRAVAGRNRVSGLLRGLPPGLYVVKIKATTADGRVSTRSKVVRVKPPPRRR
ncbi:MAG: hypothetical protein M3155_00170 [Actinomycetota bacterium]|nr:hypothetical protein [Actinomycetota bacterium]